MENYERDAIVFKAFCDVNRLQILQLLRGGEKCACVLLENLKISQSTLSYHMKILCDSGIVCARTSGKWTHYAISKEGSAYAMKRLTEITHTNSETPKQCNCTGE